MKLIKAILYWCSVIPPIIDALKGAVEGVKQGLQDVRNKHDQDERERFDKANRNE